MKVKYFHIFVVKILPKTNTMKKTIQSIFAVMAFTAIAGVASAQDYKMDGSTMDNSSGSTVAKIESDGRTIDNASGSTIAKVESDGKTIDDSHGSTALKISGDEIDNSSGSTVGHMSDVKSAISGATSDAAYVALWWFVVKGNN